MNAKPPPDFDNYFLGLPAWAFPGWKDRYFTDDPHRLTSYSGVFSAVEGNTTFYRVPDEPAIERWKRSVTGRRFRFCFKLPREVTHERNPDLAVLERFLAAIAPLRKSLGPVFVQFPATMGPKDLHRFRPVFETVGHKHRFVIEVRHRDFFEHAELLEPVLDEFAAGRVMLDSRPLYEGDRSHPEVLDALHEKPEVSVLPTVYHGIAFIRLILHPDIVSNSPYIEEWAERVAAYLLGGTETYMMIHCPNNLHCPPLAVDFHRALMRAEGMESLPALPPWPLPEQLELV